MKNYFYLLFFLLIITPINSQDIKIIDGDTIKIDNEIIDLNDPTTGVKRGDLAENTNEMLQIKRNTL